MNKDALDITLHPYQKVEWNEHGMLIRHNPKRPMVYGTLFGSIVALLPSVFFLFTSVRFVSAIVFLSIASVGAIVGYYATKPFALSIDAKTKKIAFKDSKLNHEWVLDRSWTVKIESFEFVTIGIGSPLGPRYSPNSKRVVLASSDNSVSIILTGGILEECAPFMTKVEKILESID